MVTRPEHGEYLEEQLPASLLIAAEQFVANERTFSSFRAEMDNCLYANRRAGLAVRELLNGYVSRGWIPDHLYLVLDSDIVRISSEEQPTYDDPENQAGTPPIDTDDDEPDRHELSLGTNVDIDAIDESHFDDSIIVDQPDSGDAAETAIREPQVGEQLAGRYTLLEKVSGGSMGIVFRARDESSSRNATSVAVKIIRGKLARNGRALRALKEEARKGMQLVHPNIVRTLALEQCEYGFFIVLEWLAGISLARELDRRPGFPMEPSRAWEIVSDIASALDYMHKRGVVHADVKPGNVMYTADGTVKLLDFGVSRIVDSTQGIGIEFDPGVLKAATPAYSSCEVLSGKHPLPSDDVYSLACITYRLLNGRRVFGNVNTLEARDTGMQPRPLSHLPAQRADALRQALAFDGRERPQSIREFLRLLKLRSNNRWYYFGPFGRSRWFALSVLAMLSLLVVLMYLITNRIAPVNPPPMTLSDRSMAILGPDGATAMPGLSVQSRITDKEASAFRADLTIQLNGEAYTEGAIVLASADSRATVMLIRDTGADEQFRVKIIPDPPVTTDAPDEFRLEFSPGQTTAIVDVEVRNIPESGLSLELQNAADDKTFAVIRLSQLRRVMPR